MSANKDQFWWNIEVPAPTRIRPLSRMPKPHEGGYESPVRKKLPKTPVYGPPNDFLNKGAKKWILTSPDPLPPEIAIDFTAFIMTAMRRAVERAVVYFARDETGPIKIGVADNPMTRASALQVGNPREISLMGWIYGNTALEAVFHKRFNRHKIRGEWFNPVPELIQTIDEICKPEHKLFASVWKSRTGGSKRINASHFACRLIHKDIKKTPEVWINKTDSPIILEADETNESLELRACKQCRMMLYR